MNRHPARDSDRRKQDDSRLEKNLGEWLEQGPFVLGLSSGFFGFYAHCGALMALTEQGLRPSGVAGSSAGALVGGAWAAGVEPRDIAETLEALRREDFWDPAPGFGFLRGHAFRRALEELLPVERACDAKVPVWVSAFDVLSLKTRVFTQGCLVPILHASCAVPFLFHPVWIDGRPYLDGGVADRPGLSGVPRQERVLFHHLVSKSPWRLRPPQPPPREAMATLASPGLVRVDPFRLHRGPKALRQAREATSRALDRPASAFLLSPRPGERSVQL